MHNYLLIFLRQIKGRRKKFRKTIRPEHHLALRPIAKLIIWVLSPKKQKSADFIVKCQMFIPNFVLFPYQLQQDKFMKL